MRFQGTGYSDIGRAKEVNQDSFLVKIANTSVGDVAFAAVADGMGGLAKGDLASATAIDVLSDWFENMFPLSLETMGFSVEGLEQSVEGQWSGLVQELNLKILRYSARLRVNMGTTLTAFLSIGGRYSVVHVGDTRVYEIRDDAVRVITEDQTYVKREMNAGRMTAEEAAVHSQRNVLLQCIGSSKEVKPVIFHGNIDQSATYLVCSDGFCHEISEGELIELFAPSKLKDLWASGQEAENYPLVKERIRQAVGMAMDRGECDNLTAVVIAIGKEAL